MLYAVFVVYNYIVYLRKRFIIILKSWIVPLIHVNKCLKKIFARKKSSHSRVFTCTIERYV